MPAVSFDCLKSADIMTSTTDLLNRFTGLDFGFFDIHDREIFFPCALKNKSNPACAKCQSPVCTRIRPDVVEDFARHKKITFFSCPFGMTKILVPLMLNDELAGILFVGENGSAAVDEAQRDALSKFLYRIGNYIVENESTFLPSFNGSNLSYQQELIQKVSRTIWSHVHCRDLSLAEVARKNGVSYCYLSRLFKNEIGMTFVEYRRKVKMHVAAKLLKDCRLTVDQVARACGFEDGSYFCKSFKKIYGYTPAGFRRRFICPGRKKGDLDSFIEKRTVANGYRPPYPGAEDDEIFSMLGKLGDPAVFEAQQEKKYAED